INDILDVAKIEAGKVELELGAHEVEQVCQASHRLIKEAALKKQISVAVVIDRSLRQLVADQRRLKQILVNLLSNAVKFTPQGGKIGLDVVGDRVQREVRFTVWDTGIGISPADQTRLFQPFIQLDSGLSRHTREPAWGWSSSSGSPKCMAAPCTSRARWAREAASPWSCPGSRTTVGPTRPRTAASPWL